MQILKLLITRLWYRPLPWYLTPLLLLSVLYRLFFYLHCFFYKFKKKLHFQVPVIVVGNLSVGGTGKTPLVIFLVKQFQQRGLKVGVVSRGYGGSAKFYPCIVRSDSMVDETGDEPLMIHLATQCPVVVDPNRPRAVNKLLSEFNCDVVISDDGLQHLALSRDLEIVVLDGKRRLGNGHCLPIGPLRESAKRLKRVDFVVVNDGEARAGEVEMTLVAEPWVALCDGNKRLSPSEFSGKRLHAVAGIGHPERFFQALSRQGLVFVRHVFPDHYRYQQSDFDFLASDDLLLMTEKDAVKCRLFADKRFYYLPVRAVLSENISLFPHILFNRHSTL